MGQKVSEKKLSRFIAWCLILFQTVSLTLVLGVLYGILSRSVTHEFYHEVAQKQSEI